MTGQELALVVRYSMGFSILDNHCTEGLLEQGTRTGKSEGRFGYCLSYVTVLQLRTQRYLCIRRRSTRLGHVLPRRKRISSPWSMVR